MGLCFWMTWALAPSPPSLLPSPLGTIFVWYTFCFWNQGGFDGNHEVFAFEDARGFVFCHCVCRACYPDYAEILGMILASYSIGRISIWSSTSRHGEEAIFAGATFVSGRTTGRPSKHSVFTLHTKKFECRYIAMAVFESRRHCGWKLFVGFVATGSDDAD